MSDITYFTVPDGQGLIYAYQPLIAASIALLAAILAYAATKFSAQIHIKKTRRALLDFCIHLNKDLVPLVNFIKKRQNKNLSDVQFIYAQMKQFDPTLIITSENIINLSGNDLSVVLRINGLIKFLLIKLEEDINTSHELNQNADETKNGA